MKRHRGAELLVVLTAALGGCSSNPGQAPKHPPTALPSFTNSGASPTESATTGSASAVPSTPTSPATSTQVKAVAYNLRLDAAAEPGTDSFKILVDSPDLSIKVTLKGLASPNTDTKLCPIVDLEAGSSIDACKTPKNGVAMAIPHGAKFKGVQVFQTKGAATLDVTVKFTVVDRTIFMRLPNIAPRPGGSVCKDNGCNPFFEMTPHVEGSFDATATWQAIGSGTLDMEIGKIAAHDYSAHGHPYKQVAKSSASSDKKAAKLHISGSLPANTEGAVALRNDGAKLLRSPTVRISWP